MKKEYLPDGKLSKNNVYRAPEGFFEEEINRVTALAMSDSNRAEIGRRQSPFRRIALWSAGLTAAAAMSAVFIVPATLETASQDNRHEMSADIASFSDEEVNLARPELLAENDIFLSIY